MDFISEILDNKDELEKVLILSKESNTYRNIIKDGVSEENAGELFVNILILFHRVFLESKITEADCLSQNLAIFLNIEKSDYFFYSIEGSLVKIHNISFAKKGKVTINRDLFLNILKNTAGEIRKNITSLSF